MGGAYFVGCKMTETIERSHGRDVLIELMRKNSIEFFLTYISSADIEDEYTFSKEMGELLLGIRG